MFVNFCENIYFVVHNRVIAKINPEFSPNDRKFITMSISTNQYITNDDLMILSEEIRLLWRKTLSVQNLAANCYERSLRS